MSLDLRQRTRTRQQKTGRAGEGAYVSSVVGPLLSRLVAVARPAVVEGVRTR